MEPQFLLAGIFLALTGASSALRAQLDLAPREGVYVGEGTPFPCIRFRDGSQVVRFAPPPGWKFAAEAGKCVFHPAGVAQAGGSFTALPASKDAAPRSPEQFEKLLMESVPAGATSVAFTLEGLPEVKLDSWPSRHVQASYEHFGQKFRVALLVVPLATEELHVRFGSRAADFERVFIPFLESLGTFTWNPTDEDRPKPAQSRPR